LSADHGQKLTQLIRQSLVVWSDLTVMWTMRINGILPVKSPKLHLTLMNKTPRTVSRFMEANCDTLTMWKVWSYYGQNALLFVDVSFWSSNCFIIW